MLEARTLTVGFSDSEDRLWLRLGTDHDGAVQLWLTRRVLQQLLAQVWDLLGRTLQMPPNFMGQNEPSPPAQRDQGGVKHPDADVNHSEAGQQGRDEGDRLKSDEKGHGKNHSIDQLARQRQLWIEHELAMETSPPLDDDVAREQHPAAMKAAPQSEGLLRRVHVSADERSACFQFEGPHRSLQFSGSRADAHRVLRMIWHVQTNAGWGLMAPWALVNPTGSN